VKDWTVIGAVVFDVPEILAKKALDWLGCILNQKRLPLSLTVDGMGFIFNRSFFVL